MTTADTFADKRALARLAAVQALYQMEHAAIGVNAVIREYEDYHIGGEIDGRAIREADFPFFEDLIRGVVDMQAKIDPWIERKLADGWTLKRLDATARAILRAGGYEMARRADVPAKVVIDQYLDVAHAFFEDDAREPGFINGVLDAMARDTRADELVSG